MSTIAENGFKSSTKKVTPEYLSGKLLTILLMSLVPAFFLMFYSVTTGREEISRIIMEIFVLLIIPLPVFFHLRGPKYLNREEMVVITDRRGNLKRNTRESGDWLIPYFERPRIYWPEDKCFLFPALSKNTQAKVKISFAVNLSNIVALMKFKDGSELTKHLNGLLTEEINNISLKPDFVLEQKSVAEMNIKLQLFSTIREKGLEDLISVDEAEIMEIQFIRRDSV